MSGKFPKILLKYAVVALAVVATLWVRSSVAQSNATIIEQTQYWALPGKAEEVYRWRIHACDVREKIGLVRGRVLRRQGASDSLPDVEWQIEYPNEEARLHDLKVRDESPEFKEVRDHMNTLTSHFERGFWKP